MVVMMLCNGRIGSRRGYELLSLLWHGILGIFDII